LSISCWVHGREQDSCTYKKGVLKTRAFNPSQMLHSCTYKAAHEKQHLSLQFSTIIFCQIC